MAEYKSQVWRVNVREQTLKYEPISNSQIMYPAGNRRVNIFPLLQRGWLC